MILKITTNQHIVTRLRLDGLSIDIREEHYSDPEVVGGGNRRDGRDRVYGYHDSAGAPTCDKGLDFQRKHDT